VPTALEFVESRTQAPSLLTEHELIALMDTNGIGTDATVAQHISTIQNRKYAHKEGAVFRPSELGIALVASYEAIAIELHKPALRAAMEADMTRICLGQRTREDVVKDCLTQMRSIFLSVVENGASLVAAMSQHFRRAGVGHGQQSALLAASFSRCGICRSQMDLKSEGTQRLLYCATCARGFALQQYGALRALQHDCPICSFQALEVHNEQFDSRSNVWCVLLRGSRYRSLVGFVSGGMFLHFLFVRSPAPVLFVLHSPHCYNHPPADQMAEGGGGEGSASSSAATFTHGFTCRSCAHPTCPLARRVASDFPVCPCKTCGSRMMVLKKTAVGSASASGSVGSSKIFVSCKGAGFGPQACKGSLNLPG
jgi:hypothetical protein